MEIIYLGLWKEFACLAGACPSTCCAGWNIVVDEQTILRIQELPSASELREAVLRHIRCNQNGEYCFENRPDGSCSMLRKDGLCRIWHDAGEMLLCNTCRKYPQLIDQEGETMRLSMDASCPVVAEYLWQGDVEWFRIRNVSEEAELGEYQQILQRERYDIHTCLERRRERESCQKLREYAEGCAGNDVLKSRINIYEIFWDVMEGCLDLLLQSPEMPYLAGCFDYFEDWCEERFVEDLRSFAEIWRRELCRFASNYIPYRLFGLSFSDSKVQEEDRASVVLGELNLLYIISFSRFHILEGVTESQMVENINWVYRFTAHGQKRQQRVKEWFVENQERLEVFFHAFYL